jgi:hypothetical protein
MQGECPAMALRPGYADVLHIYAGQPQGMRRAFALQMQGLEH